MKKLTLLALTLLACVAPCLAAPSDFTIKKVDVEMIPSPDINAGNSGIRWAPQKWVRIEVTFDAVPEFTDELQFNYYALASDRPAADRLLVGKVTHVNICKGSGLHSVMYISPQALAKFFSGRKQVNITTLFTQVSVTLSKAGSPAPVSIGSLKQGGHGEWWNSYKQEDGFLINKNETPYAPLYWDYYEAIKAH
jgi:hypothetical protein